MEIFKRKIYVNHLVALNSALKYVRKASSFPVSSLWIVVTEVSKENTPSALLFSASKSHGKRDGHISQHTYPERLANSLKLACPFFFFKRHHSNPTIHRPMNIGGINEPANNLQVYL